MVNNGWTWQNDFGDQFLLLYVGDDMINDFSSFTRWYSNVLVKVVDFNDVFVAFKCNWWFQVVDIRVTCYYNDLIPSAVYDR